MYGIVLFGALMIILSLVMVVNPVYWSKTIVRYSQLSYFHLIEIITRLSFGFIFLTYADQTLYPLIMKIIGYILLAVGVGLIFLPPSKHKQFAVWSSVKFKNVFGPAGLFTIVFGVFIIYAALQGKAF